MTTMHDPAWSALLQISSPAFPVGGFSYSQGLESAIDQGWVKCEASLQSWLVDQLQGPIRGWDLVHVRGLLHVWSQPETAALNQRLIDLDASHMAGRESAELWQESQQMAWSLRQLLRALLTPDPTQQMQMQMQTLGAHSDRIDRLWPPEAQGPSHACVWSALASAWAMPEALAMQAWLWSWLENQVMVALKTVPLGQSVGQRVLLGMRGHLRQAIDESLAEEDAQRWSGQAGKPGAPMPELGHNLYPGLGLLCARHETQYCRLFRS